MLNLFVSSERHRVGLLPPIPPSCPPYSLHYDSPTKTLYSIRQNDNNLTLIHSESLNILSNVALPVPSSPPSSSPPSALPPSPLIPPHFIHWHSDLETLSILSTNSKSLHQYNPNGGTFETVGEFPSHRILNSAVSPDGEIRAIITEEENSENPTENILPSILLMSKESDILNDIPLSVCFDRNTPLSVHQSQSKSSSRLAALPTTALLWESGEPKYFITQCYADWRPDGRHLAILISFTVIGGDGPKGNFRQIALFTRGGQRESSSEIYQSMGEGGRDIGGNGIGGLVNWSARGHLLCTTQRREVGDVIKHEVIFFERNGLRHGEFTIRQMEKTRQQGIQDTKEEKTEIQKTQKSVKSLPKKKAVADDNGDDDDDVLEAFDESEKISASQNTSMDCEVFAIRWNSEGDILAISMADIDEGGKRHGHCIQLWTMMNYHYYLKHTVRMGEMGDFSLQFTWDPEDAKHLIALDSSTGSLLNIHLSWDSAVSTDPSRTVAVIDSSALLLTPIGRAVIPPPMSDSSIKFPSTVQMSGWAEIPSFREPYQYESKSSPVVAPSSASTSPFAVLTESKDLFVFPSFRNVPNAFLKTPTEYGVSFRLSLRAADCGFQFHRLRLLTFVPLSPSSLSSRRLQMLFIEALPNGTDNVVEIIIAEDSGELLSALKTPIPSASTVLRISVHSALPFVLLSLSDSSLLQYTPSDPTDDHSVPSLTPYAPFPQLPSPSAHFAVVKMDTDWVIFSRDSRHRLYAHDTLISPQCSSFTDTHPSFFGFTILGQQNAVFFLSLRHSLEVNMSHEVRQDSHSVRFIERGAVILTIVPSLASPRVVMEMPRGNLETVYPRALTLESINLSLAHLDYKAAYKSMRSNRIDFNILYDHSPEDFMRNLEKFVRDIENPEYFNVFISNLRDQNVLKEQFPQYKTMETKGIQSDNKTKDTQLSSSSPVDPVGVVEEFDRVRFGLSLPSLSLLSSRDDRMAFKKSMGRQAIEDRKKREERAKGFEEKERGEWERRRAEERDGQMGGQKSAKHRMKATWAITEKSEIAHAAGPFFGHSAPQSSNSPKSLPSSKVNFLCHSFRQLFFRLDAQKYFFPILTTFVKQSPPDLEGALLTIKGLLTDKSMKSLQSALKYVIFLCDVKDLYRSALGMYDFPMALLVAQQSQMDPREFNPFIQSFTAMRNTVNYQRYSVDTYLERWESATIHLLMAVRNGEIPPSPHYQNVLQMTIKHSLFPQVIDVITPKTFGTLRRDPKKTTEEKGGDITTAEDFYSAVLCAFASNLRSKRTVHKAVVCFLLGGSLSMAMETFKEAGDWRAVIVCALQMGMNEMEIQQIAYQLSEILGQSSRKAIDAATLLVEYADDVDKAISILLKHSEFTEAIRIANKWGRKELMKSDILPAIRSAGEKAFSHLTSVKRKYRETALRLRVVRRMKLLAAASVVAATNAAGENGEDDALGEIEGLLEEFVDEVDDDLQSIVSGASISSAVSGKSTKSTVSSTLSIVSTSSVFTVSTFLQKEMTADEKKQAKALDRQKRRNKKKRVKEGTEYEEENLLSALCDLTLNSIHIDKNLSLVRTLLITDHNDLARDVHEALQNLLDEQTEEEKRPMPEPLNATEQQREAIRKHWNWPECVREFVRKQLDREKEREENRMVGLGRPMGEEKAESTEENKNEQKGDKSEKKGESKKPKESPPPQHDDEEDDMGLGDLGGNGF